MNPVTEVGLLTARELRKNLRSAKGLVLLVLCVLGAIATALLLARAKQIGAEHNADTAQMKEANEQFLTDFYDKSVAHSMADTPAVALMMLIGTVWLAPMFIALLAFDSISAELQHRSVRYWTVRMRRASFYVGKVTGVFSVVAVITLAMHALAWGIAIARGASGFGETVSWGLHLWAASLPIQLAWCSLAVFISSLSKTPILALLFSFAANFAMWLIYVIGKARKTEELTYLYPNRFDVWLLSPDASTVVQGVLACMAFVVVFSGVGVFLFQRRDV